MQQRQQQVVLLGAGNVATQLGTALQRAGFHIRMIWSRTMSSAQTLAERLGCCACTELSELPPDADIYLYALKDDVIGNISAQLKFCGGLHLHTAGSVSVQTFSPNLIHTGVLYPFQTFSKGKEVDFSKIPILIESRLETDLEPIRRIALTLTEQVYQANAEQRAVIHLSGVIACNFSNQLYAIAQQLLEKENIPFSILLPLIRETVDKLSTLSPQQGQTGPAVRHDQVVIGKHIKMLEAYPEWQTLYKRLTDEIEKTHSGNEQNC